MNSDCAFVVGRSHTVCQDYAIAGSDPHMHYTIIADGCSSSRDTDIGARFLVKAAETFLYQIMVSPDARRSLERYHQQAIQFAALGSKVLKLDPSSLDATLMTVKASGNTVIASCYGDGVVALGRKDGRLEIYSIEFIDGYPQYVSYTLDALRRIGFDAQKNNTKEVTHHWLPLGAGTAEVVRSTEVIEFYFGYSSDYRFVAVMSDGVHSFVEGEDIDTAGTTQSVSIQEVVPLLLAFKDMRGDFVQRRIKSFLTICASRNWLHNDDLSVGVIAFD